jgi:hypothetical protein
VKYRKKPVVVEAMQVDGTEENARQIEQWTGGAAAAYMSVVADQWGVMVNTLEGTMTGTKGWWIIQGVQGEFYPCKDDIFHATYEPAQ